MSGNWDATIKLLYPVDHDKHFAVDAIPAGREFDVVADVEAGKGIMAFADRYDLYVAVRNLSKSTTLMTRKVNQSVMATNNPWHQQIRITFAAGWAADDGDVLDVIAAFKFSAGVNEDYSIAHSEPFVVAK